MRIADKVMIEKGDLTEMDVDAIVNAANNDLKLGGGIAGAIRRKGGEAIQHECDEIGSIPVGDAAITSGGRLKARFVIHAASMQLGGRTTAYALRSSTAHALRIAREKGLRTIAFPAVGTGIAGFPTRECAEIMLREVVEHLKQPTSVQKVYFVLFDQAARDVFEEVWSGMKAEGHLDAEADAAGKASSRPKR
ncbi:MAG TPA: macro domain-containing protein [Candidatus Acidoferrales bacterium]|nr:macro domain-containing protein [Candidatus Acidoferrales bacterium]